MANEVFNSSGILGNITDSVTSNVSSGLGSLILILKAIGILFVIYLIFLIVRAISNMITNRRIKKIYNKVNEMDLKLDKIIENHKPKEKNVKNDSPNKTKK